METSHLRLGIDAGRHAPKKLAETILSMIGQAQRQILIYSRDLDRHCYDHEAVCSAMLQLARRSRNSNIKLLIADSSSIVQHGHRLIELQRRLTSIIQVRKLPDRVEPPSFNLLVCDARGLVWQSVQDPDQCWADFHCPPSAENFLSQFMHLWEQSEIDPELQRLHI